MISRPLSLTLLACAVSATLALAHEDATGVVKERMDLMETQKDAMKVIGEMAKGKTPFDAAAATKAANDMGSTAKKIPELFPEGTGGDANKSDALPAIGRSGTASRLTRTTWQPPPMRSSRRSATARAKRRRAPRSCRPRAARAPARARRRGRRSRPPIKTFNI